MSRRLFPRLTYANVISSLALFIVLGGGAWAATTLPANSVGFKQLKDGSVGTRKLQDHSVGTGQLKNNAVNASKVNQSSLTAIPGTVKPVNAALGASQALTTTVNGVTLSETADGAGNCTAIKLTPSGSGFVMEGNHASYSGPTAASSTTPYTSVRLFDGRIGEIAFAPSDGSAGATFHVMLTTQSSHCLVEGYGAG